MPHAHTTTSAATARTPAARLEQARRRVSQALRAADEGALTVETADAISRALVDAQGDLEAVAVEFDTRPRATA